MWRNPTALGRAISAAAFLAAGAVAAPVSAETFTVTNTSNAGPGSLRDAMTQANATAGADLIVFSGLAPGSVITVDAELPDVSEELIIDGSGVPGLVLQGFDPSLAAASFLITDADLTLVGVSLDDGGVTANEGTTLVLEAGATPVVLEGALRGEPALVRKTGPGLVNLTGYTSFTDGISVDVEIAQGTLRVDGVLEASAVRVARGASLSGAMGPSPALVDASLTVQGRVAPSGPNGLLSVGDGQPTAFGSGSVLEVDVDTDDSDELSSGGTITVANGSFLDIRPTDAVFESGTAGPQTVVSAVGIDGTFATPDFLVLDEIVVQDGTTITVELLPNGESLSTVAVTPNQQAVAAVLESLQGGATGDLADVFDALNQATRAEVPRALDAIGGEPLSAFATARQILGERTARALHRRVRDAAWGEFEPAWAASADLPLPVLAAGPTARPRGFRAHPSLAARPRDPLAPEPPPPGPLHGGAWVDAYGVFGELEGTRGAADLDTNLYGGTLGADLWIWERLVVGLAAGYAHGDVDPDGRDVDLTADVIQGALYAGYAHPRGFLSAYGRYAYAFQDSTRRIDAGGLARTADASFESQDWGAGAEAGVTLFRAGPVAFQPLAGIDWLLLSEDDYRESGAGSLSLDVRPDDLESTTARLGGRLVARFALDDEATELVPELRAFWQTELGDRERVLNARLLGAGSGGAIRVAGAELPQNVLLLGLGWSVQVSPQLQVFADYDALLGSDRVEHQAGLAFRVRF